MASIRLNDVVKTYINTPVVKGVSLDVQDGEFVVLLGPSGCGKSTLLRMIAGLESLSGGSIHIGDKRVDPLPPTERDIAFVFQSYALYPHMTVRRNIAFPLIMRQHRWWFHLPLIGSIAKRRIERSQEVANLVEKTAKMLALTPWLDKLPRTLSGGQRQRVALGRAMVRQPQVFLMDEPLSNLDAKLRTTMRSEIAKLHQRVGGTFVYVTHDQVEAMTMGTRIALLKDGVVQQFGTPRDIYESPANTYVARFIGSPPMNLLQVHIHGAVITMGRVTLSANFDAVSLPASFEGEAILGVRPNQISLTTCDTDQGLSGHVALVEHIGAESLITVALTDIKTLHDEENSAPNEVMVVLPGYSQFNSGQRVSLQLNLANAVFFCATTHQRLVINPASSTHTFF